MAKFTKINFLIVLLLPLFWIGGFLAVSKNPPEKDIPSTPVEGRIISPDFPGSFTFAGEEVPLRNFEVRERLDREIVVNTYWHSSTILMVKRAKRWLPVIEPILKEEGVPDDFKYIAMIESNLTNAVSPKGAKGFWQFLKYTGKKHGLEINKCVDERYHVEKSTKAACSYLKNAYEMFGSWTLAAASYNMGETGVEKQLERQKADNYYNLVLSDETSRYIFRAIAAKIIINDPEKYGFYLNEEDLYPPLEYYEVPVNHSIKHLADFAARHGYNYKILKMFNPWLRENYLSNKKGKIYKIKFPVHGSIHVIE